MYSHHSLSRMAELKRQDIMGTNAQHYHHKAHDSEKRSDNTSIVQRIVKLVQRNMTHLSESSTLNRPSDNVLNES